MNSIIEDSIYYRHLNNELGKAKNQFHLHDRFEIFYLIENTLEFFIERYMYLVQSRDMIITNTHETHRPAFQPGQNYHRVVIQFEPALVQSFSTASFNLLGPFINRPKGKHNKRSLTSEQANQLLSIFNKIENLDTDPTKGYEVLKLNCLVELLALINCVYMENTSLQQKNPLVSDRLIPLLDYIDQNLDSDLSLDTLEETFHISKYHLSRLFKRNFGNTIHDYIIYKRISLAKELLADGESVATACSRSGFVDYSNFLRRFRQTVGVSPGKYKTKGVDASKRTVTEGITGRSCNICGAVFEPTKGGVYSDVRAVELLELHKGRCHYASPYLNDTNADTYIPIG